MTDRERNENGLDAAQSDRIDESVARAARTLYNTPPDAPREEMWAIIRAARSAEGGVRPASSGTPVIHLRRMRPQAWWAAVAAALVIGVALGRGSSGGGPDGQPTVAEAPADAGRGLPTFGAEGTRATTVPRSYRVAAARHLTRTENFLTMFQVDARSADVDSDLGPWARRLLTDTRLLLDSPAGADPELRMLLGDLELVLAQIVQLPIDDPEEVEIIDEGLESSQLLFRLRAVKASTPRMVGL